ncbi:MAG: hypothetical protein IJO34_05615 [Akkermansia sp.]|nr:hypothetical protein [Akkermansia sp.]
MFLLFIGLSAVLFGGCRQLVNDVLPKSIAPEVVQQARKPGSWYSHLPERDPHFCLRTETSLKWHDPKLKLGYWKGLHPESPHRVLMEAKGDTLIVHRHYVWDGCTVGETKMRDLLATLRHDALYHALKEGADFSRRQVDLAFWRDQERADVGFAWLNYLCVRLFGGFYNRSQGEKTMLIEPTPKEDTL